MIRGKKIGYHPVSDEVKAERAKIAAEREAKIEQKRLEEVAAYKGKFTDLRDFLVEKLGDDLGRFIELVRNTNMDALKQELLRIEKAEAAKKLAAGRVSAALAFAQAE
jgi:hypothetical protein